MNDYNLGTFTEKRTLTKRNGEAQLMHIKEY